MDPELKKLLETLNTEFDAFKAKNDERLAAIEKGGRADPLLEGEVEKINNKITDISQAIEDHKATAKRVTELEAAMDRPNFGGAGGEGDKVARKASEFFSAVRGEPIAAGQAEVDELMAYSPAFGAYLRKGKDPLQAAVQAALSVGSDPDGGYWIEPDTNGGIVQMVYETSPMRQFANVTTIGTDALEGVNDLDEAGGGWVGETQSRDETSTPEIGKYRIEAHEMYAQPRATQKMLDDSMVNVEAWLSGKVSQKFSRIENTAFVNGDGVTKPRGFLTYASGTPAASAWNVIEQVNTGANGAFAGSNPGDVFHTIIGQMKADYLPGAVFATNRAGLAAARKLKDGDGTYLWEKSFQAAQPFQLLGYPVAMFEDMPALATGSLSFAFGNFRAGYQIVDRVGIRVLRDPFTAKPYVKFYTTKRVGGDVVNFEAIKLMRFAA